MNTTTPPLTVITRGKLGELEADDEFYDSSEYCDLGDDDAIHALDQKGRLVELSTSYVVALTAAPFEPEGVTMVWWKDGRGVERLNAQSIATPFTGPGKPTEIVLKVVEGSTLREEPFDVLRHADYGVLDAVAKAVYAHQMDAEQRALVNKFEGHGSQLDRSQAVSLVHALSDLAAKHQKLSEIDLRDGLSASQSHARDAIEQLVKDLLADVPGVSGAKFLYDPRGETTGIVFDDGAGNSLNGSWKVPVTTHGYRALADQDFWTEWAGIVVDPMPEPSYIVLRIDETGNAAFVDGGGREHEIARILKDAGQKVVLAKEAGRPDPDGIKLFDLNGNKVGSIDVVDAKPAGEQAPGTLRLVLDNAGGALTSDPEDMDRVARLFRVAAANIEEGVRDFALAMIDENGNRKEYGTVVYAAPESELQHGRIHLADHFSNNGVRKADDGYSGIAEGEYRYVVGVGDFEFGYGLDAGPVYLVNAKGEVADGYEDGDKVVRETYTSTLSRDELAALRAVAEGSLSFEDFEKRFGEQDAEADDEPEV